MLHIHHHVISLLGDHGEQLPLFLSSDMEVCMQHEMQCCSCTVLSCCLLGDHGEKLPGRRLQQAVVVVVHAPAELAPGFCEALHGNATWNGYVIVQIPAQNAKGLLCSQVPDQFTATNLGKTA